MPNIPVVKARKMMKVAQKAGFIYEITHGSHFVFRRPTDRKMVSIPSHKGKDLGRGITRVIIKQMGLTVEEFLKLL